MAQSSYQLINLISNITLNWPFSFSGAPFILDINDVNPDQNGRTITLPNALLATAGQNFIFNNVSGFSFEILANDSSTIITTIITGEIVQLYLTNVSTANGTWRVIPYGSGTSAITQFTAESTDSSIDIANGTVTPPTGVIDFKLPTSIYNLNNIVDTGFIVVDSLSPLTFKTVTFLSDSNLVITDPDGIAGDPVFNLSTTTIGPVASINVGDMVITGEVITNTTNGGNIQLSSSGSGEVQLNGVRIDANGNIFGINNFVAPKAFAVFTDTITGMTNTIVVEESTNIVSVTGSAGSYVITFTTPMSSANYAVMITMGTTEGNLPFISTGYFLLRETTSVTITVTDASGQLVLSAPNGISVMIMST